MRHFFVFLILLLLPITVLAQEADFLRPVVQEIHRSIVCPMPESCQAVFLINGRNFVNTNGVGAVKVGDGWAEVVKWTETSIVALSDVENLERPLVVTVDTEVHRPKLVTGDAILDLMFEQSVQVALDSIHMTSDGVRYVTAGPRYGAPERVYYRDTYWTSGMVLLIEPSVIRNQILLLSRGLGADGSAPSAVTVYERATQNPLWVDHIDSGSYLVMLVYDYLAWTGDTSVLNETVGGKRLFVALEDALSYLSTKDSDGNLLIEKTSEDALKDWADSIKRPGEVLYNQTLYYRALRNMSDIATLVGEDAHATSFHRHSLLLRYRINERLWNDVGGSYYERCDEQVCVDRLTNDSATALLYEIVYPQNRERFFTRLLDLESRRNTSMLYGDWGVSNVWPLYEDARGYFYQNGTDWPFLDAINAGARLKFGDGNWYYPLTRWFVWWSYSGREGVLPEFVSPIDDSTGVSQAWSTAPAFSFVRYGLGLDPDLSGRYQLNNPLGTLISIDNFHIRGRRLEKKF